MNNDDQVSSQSTGQTPGEPDFPSPQYSWYVVFVLFLAYVVSFLDRQILTLLVEPIKADLQISDTMLSLLHGFTFAIFYTVFGLPLGRMADNHKRTGLIMVGVALWSAMTAACGLARNALMLFFARIGVAVGEAALSPSAYSLISDYFPRGKRGRAISLYSLGIFAGAGMAYIFGGLVTRIASESVVSTWPILSSFKPWQITFFITALPGLLIIALMLTVREPLRRERLKSETTGLSMREAVVYTGRHFRLYFAMLVGNSFIALANYALFAWLPAYFIRVYGYTPGRIGATFGTILLLFGTAGLLLGGMLADFRFRRGHLAAHYNLTIGLTALGIIPAFLIMGGGGEVLQLALVAALVFFASVSTGLIPAATQLVTPNELRGQMTAVYLMLTAIIGLGLGPTAVALLVDFHFEDTMAVGKAMSIVITVSLSIAVLLMLIGKSVYRQRQQQIKQGVM